TSPPTEGAEMPADENEAPTSTETSGRTAGTTRAGAEPTPSSAATYTVESGDSLWRIAASVLRSGGADEPSSADIGRFWPAIYEANRTLIGDNPNLIFPGQRLVIPEG
ncbi:MAG: LysM peptidoglycan-binding domain-containing protein, partial [Actinomycetota bacterium]|nr:LysM peptidoglycan-binding domain-containing protein [Actinomycetota bacterium]